MSIWYVFLAQFPIYFREQKNLALLHFASLICLDLRLPFKLNSERLVGHSVVCSFFWIRLLDLKCPFSPFTCSFSYDQNKDKKFCHKVICWLFHLQPVEYSSGKQDIPLPIHHISLLFMSNLNGKVSPTISNIVFLPLSLLQSG